MNIQDLLSNAPLPKRMTEAEFAKEQEDYLKCLPPELRSPVAYYAYEKGHSAGYEDILSHVKQLVEMLNLPVAALVKRLGH